jgi:thioredoxin reductase (NADPH)
MVIGGGNSALQEAVMLSEICSHVTIVQNLGFLTGEEMLAEKLKNAPNVDVIYNCVVEALDGEDFLNAVILHDVSTGESKLLDTEGVFVAIGQQPENGAFAEVTDLDDNGYIIAGEDCMCSTPGVFAAGDCRTKRVRQITTATGDGATAAVGACRYLDSL